MVVCLFFPTGTRKCPSRHGTEHAQVHAAKAPNPPAVDAASSTSALGGTGAQIEALDGAREIS